MFREVSKVDHLVLIAISCGYKKDEETKGEEKAATMADEEVLFDDVYELCEIIGKWVSHAQRLIADEPH